MKLFKERVLKHSIEINAPVKKVWEFFDNLDSNYKSWHPESHVNCRWIKGRPHEKGSVAYFEEILDGQLCKIKILCNRVEKFKSVECKSFFPLSIFHPKSIYLFEDKGRKCIFTAINQMRIPIIFNWKILSLVDATEKHMKEEGENLKEITENK